MKTAEDAEDKEIVFQIPCVLGVLCGLFRKK